MWNTTGTQTYPMAVVTIDLDGHHYEKEVGVSGQLREDDLLGMDVSLWPHLIKSLNPEEVAKVRMLVQQQEDTLYAVSTRAQTKQRVSIKDLTVSAVSTEETETANNEEESTGSAVPAESEAKTVNQDDETDYNGESAVLYNFNTDVSHMFPFDDTLFGNRDIPRRYKTHAER